ncbi:MAG: clostripain-related cysteine peptidase, partial [Anaerolineae bacterium]
DWNPGELDMGDPDTLVNFVTWVRNNYPAKYYLLSILDHGGGWSPTFTDTSDQRLTSPSLRQSFIPPLRRSYYAWGGTGLSWDFSDDYDYLSTAEMSRAFNSITREGSEKMDVVFYDACLMGMIEEAYEIKEYVNYFIGSENEAWGSMPYDQYINSITSSTEPRELAVGIVNDYTASLPLTGHPSTMSAVDLAAINEVSLAVDSLAQTMIDGLSLPETVLQIQDAYLLAQKFDYDSNFRLQEETDGYVDLYHLALKIQENVTDTAIVDAAQVVTNALGSGDGPFIIAEQHRSGYPWVITETLEYWNLDNAHGISIYLPLGQDLQMILENEEGLTQTIKVRVWYNEVHLSFAADTRWDEFIAAYYAATPTPIPTYTLPGPRGGIRPIQRRVYFPIVFKK